MRIVRVLGVALGLLGALAGHAAAQQNLRSVTLAVPAFSLSFSLQYLADDLGLWQKHGLAVKSTLIAGVGSANAVIGGSADVADASPPTLTRAAAHGQNLLAIAALQDRLFVEVVLRKDLAPNFDPKAPLKQRAQLLKGRTIAVDSINSIIHAYVLLLAARGGFDAETIRVAPMQPNAMLAAFAAHQIDGFAMSLPWPRVPVLAGTGVIVASGPAGDPPDMTPFANALVVVRPETCASRKWLCQGVAGAVADAAAFLHQNPDRAFALLDKRFPTLSAKLVRNAFATLEEVTPDPPAPVEAELANAETLNIEAGLMKPDQRLKSYAALWTDEYVK